MTNKNKNIVLIAGFLLLLILSYKLAISRTFAVKAEYKTLKKEEALMQDIPRQLATLNRKQHYYEGMLSKYQLSGSSIQNNLLKTINSYSKDHHLKVVQFLEPHVIKGNDLTVKTYQFTLEGDYNNMLGLIHKLEQDTRFGEIINLHFEKKINYRTGRPYLQAHVLLKSFG